MSLKINPVSFHLLPRVKIVPSVSGFCPHPPSQIYLVPLFPFFSISYTLAFYLWFKCMSSLLSPRAFAWNILPLNFHIPDFSCCSDLRQTGFSTVDCINIYSTMWGWYSSIKKRGSMLLPVETRSVFAITLTNRMQQKWHYVTFGLGHKKIIVFPPGPL